MSTTPFNPLDLKTLGHVWLVISESGTYEDYIKEIHAVCYSEEVAKEVAEQLRQKILDIKSEYFSQHGSTYEEDLITLTHGLSIEKNEDMYSVLSERIFIAETKNELLAIHNIEINKMDLTIRV